MEPKTLEILTGLVFIVTYALIVMFYRRKVRVIWIGVVLMLLLGAVSFSSAFESINWNVIGIYVGMLFIAEALVRSRMPDYLAVWITNRSGKVWTTMIFLCALTGALSIFIENVACVLLVAPIAFAIAKNIRVSPVPMIIGCAISSNLQGVATLIGDPPSMLLAGYAGLTFNDFFVFHGRPSLFFAVQLGMVASLFVLYLFFRKFDHPVKHFNKVNIRSYFPSMLLVVMIIVLASVSILDYAYSPGLICVVFGFACLLWMIKNARETRSNVINSVESMEWGTGFFIIAVFIMVESLSSTGIITDIAGVIYGFTGSSIMLTFVTVVAISVFISAFIDNIPYIVAMLPVTQIIAEQSGISPFVIYFGLLIGASVGGNITPVGAAANIVGVGLLKNRGYETTFWDFVRIGLPFTIVSVTVSAGFIWFMFG